MAQATDLVWSMRREGCDHRHVDVACGTAPNLGQGSLGALARPFVYGAPGELSNLLDATAAHVEREPDESFRDSGVLGSVRHLTALLDHRLTEAD